MSAQLDATGATVERVTALLGAARFTASNERALQRGVGDVLGRAYPGAFLAEYRLNAHDRPDFWNGEHGIVLEVKWGRSGGSDTSVVRQLRRYADDPRVRAIIFATPSRRVAYAVPHVLGAVPVTGVVLHTGL